MTTSGFLRILLCALISLTLGCSKRVKPAENVDACSLLTDDEVASIQGTTISVHKASSASGAGMLVSQCVYGSTEPNKSVGIALSQIGSTTEAPRSPTAFWDATFARFRKSEKAVEKEAESEKLKKESLREKREETGEDEVIPPVKVEGVGDEAFWSPSRVGGALYAIKRSRDAFIRISVGGPGTEQDKIEKSKKLALNALRRL